MKTITLLMVLSLFAIASTSAQQPTQAELDSYIEMARMDLRQGRADLVGANMGLSTSQAAAFWPMFEQYEAAYTELGDTELELIRDFAAAFRSMTDDAASDLASRLLDLEQEQQELLREYHGRIEGELGGAVAARFVQIERRIATLIDLQLQAEVPLLQLPR